MSWSVLIQIIADEVGAVRAARIEEEARRVLGGVRITISKRRRVSVEQIDQAAPGRPGDAANQLGVHRSTVYRTIRRHRLIR